MRIIAGEARGRRLYAPAGEDTRPTSDRVRESLFNILGRRVLDARVLDLFCGSGALSFEAVSRGAQSAVLIDADSKAVRTARSNAQALDMQRQVRVYRNDYQSACRILLRKNAVFDLVFVDPPYAQGLYASALQAVAPLLADGALIVCEHASHQPLEAVLAGLTRTDLRTYGTRALSFYRKEEGIV